ncbi:MAG: ABC transporter ATP-binding protein [Clostridia bacterium]|nr:ABC transporter ATP-binding protein [Clostridia bacterium]
MKLSKYLKPYIWFIILAPVLMVLEVCMDLLQPAMMSTIVNDGILGLNDAGTYGNMDVILSTCIKMLVFALIGAIGGMGCTYFSTKASQNFGADLRADLFRKIESFSFAETDKFSTGSLVTRTTNDVMQLQNMVLMALRMLVRTPMQCIGGIVMAILINPKFGIILLILMPILIALVAFFITKTSPIFSKMQQKLDRLNGIMQENLSGVRVVKAYVRESHEVNKFVDANNDYTGTSLKVMRLMAALSPIMMIIMNVATIAVIVIGSFEVEAKAMLVGDVMAVVTYMTQILMSMMMMSMMFMNISRAKASYQRIKAVMDTNPSIYSGNEEEQTVEKGKIEFKNVTFKYPLAVGEPVIKNVNLTVNPGETVAFLGATGSGKSSLVNLVPRFYDVTEGQVLVDGVDVKDYDLDNLRAGIGMVLQEAVLFSGTIMENIKWGNPNASDEEAIAAAKIAQADDYISNFPDGYNTMLGQRGLTLSGGQKQRLSISRAVLKKPKILILDDSTSALDMGTEARLQKALKETMSGMTSIIIAQRISSVMYADKIVVLDKGEVVAVGTHEELLKNSEIYQDIYLSQVGEGGVDNG